MKLAFHATLLGSALLSLALVGCSANANNSEEAATAGEKPLNVRVLEVSPTDLEEALSISGTLRATRATDISTEESGVVVALPHDKGERVAKGDVIVGLDRRLLGAELKSAEAAVTLREYNEERTRKLYEANSVSKQEMLLVYTELQQAKEAARVAELRHERAQIAAPFAGVVADRFVEIGQLVAPGTRVARVVDPFTLKLVGAVTEREVLWIREGAPALIAVEGLEETLVGRVAYVALEANPMNGKFPVEITVDNRSLKLRAGVVGRARILTRVHEDVLAIPRSAVINTLDGSAVYVVEEGHARQLPVELGADQGMMVIVASGLEAQQQLVVRGQRQLQPGTPVTVQETATHRDGSIASDPDEVRESKSLEGLRDLAASSSVGGDRR